jgi:hypothetical protein
VAGSLPGGDGSPAARDAGGSAWRVGRRTQNVPEAGRLATVTQHRCDIGAPASSPSRSPIST